MKKSMLIVAWTVLALMACVGAQDSLSIQPEINYQILKQAEWQQIGRQVQQVAAEIGSKHLQEVLADLRNIPGIPRNFTPVLQYAFTDGKYTTILVYNENLILFVMPQKSIVNGIVRPGDSFWVKVHRVPQISNGL
jgi:hypothetical protein